MSKTPTTLRMEALLKRKYGNTIGKFIVYEIQFGFHQYDENKQYCDAATYDTNKELVCFELKASVSDFHSKCKKTFFGHKNYYVMPLNVYEKVKDEIPLEIGVQVLCETKYVRKDPNDWRSEHKRVIEPGDKELFTIKKCIRQKEAKVDENTILWSFVRSMCNSSNRAVELNAVEVDEVIKKHLEIVDTDDLEGQKVNIEDVHKIKNPAIQLFVPREECHYDFYKLLRVMRGGF